MRIFVGSRFRGEHDGIVLQNVKYARECCRSLVTLGHNPLALHLHDPQFLNDDIEEERALGLKNGKVWLHCADCAIFFTDLGVSDGMKGEIAYCQKKDIPYFMTTLDKVEDAVRQAVINAYAKKEPADDDRE